MKIRDGKIRFDNGQEEEKSVRDQLEKVNEILRLLRDTLIVPLSEILPHAPDTDELGSQADCDFSALRAQAPWREPIKIADEAFSALQPARTFAVDQLRAIGFPRCSLPSPAKIFIASTSESLDVAREISAQLSKALGNIAEVDVWKDSKVFQQNDSTWESLIGALEVYQFGIAFFSAEDRMDNFRPDGSFPIGNVILEHGLFTGRHSRARAFIVHPEAGVPGLSDLKGINTAQYSAKAEMDEVISTIIDKLAPAIRAEIAEYQRNS